MITLIHGENAYERDQALQQIVATYDGAVEQYDGAEVAVEGMKGLFSAQTLFSDRRLIVIKNLGDNKEAWQGLEVYVRDDIDADLVLLEPKLDKRTKTYKALLKKATTIECTPFDDRDRARVVMWLRRLAETENIALTEEAARLLVARVGDDQYMLKNELNRLSAVGEVTLTVVEVHTEETIHDTAFALLEMALDRQAQSLAERVRRLKMTEDAYRTFGLLVSQVFALAVVAASNPSDDIKDTGVHPFVARKMRSVGSRVSPAMMRAIVEECTQTDRQLKGSAVDPWLLIETLLLRIARLEK